MADVFISFARTDEPQAAAIAAALADGALSVSWGQDPVGSAADARAEEREIDHAAAVVIAWSKAARESLRIRAHASAALDGGKLVQLTLDGVTAPLPFAMLPVLDESARRELVGEPWSPLKQRVDELVANPPRSGPLAPPWEWALQGFGQIAILGWTAIASALLTGLFTIAAARGNITGATLGVVSLVLLVLALGLLGAAAFICVRTLGASRR